MIVWLEGAQDGSFLGWSEGPTEGMVGSKAWQMACGMTICTKTSQFLKRHYQNEGHIEVIVGANTG